MSFNYDHTGEILPGHRWYSLHQKDNWGQWIALSVISTNKRRAYHLMCQEYEDLPPNLDLSTTKWQNSYSLGPLYFSVMYCRYATGMPNIVYEVCGLYFIDWYDKHPFEGGVIVNPPKIKSFSQITEGSKNVSNWRR